MVRKLILASGSPRRADLMRAAGYDFEIVRCPLAEPSLDGGLAEQGLTAGEWAESLALFKAAAVAQDYPDALVVGADTIVVHGETVLGKAAAEAEARRILSNMFAGENLAITGVAVLGEAAEVRVVEHVVTRLVMRAMSGRELDDYLASGAWRDKAGAYALQEGGDKFVALMEGSESNVVGLPMERLGEILGGLGY